MEMAMRSCIPNSTTALTQRAKCANSDKDANNTVELSGWFISLPRFLFCCNKIVE